MDLQTARAIVDTLAQGIHPGSGEAMPHDSPYSSASVVEALRTVSRALDGAPPRPRSRREDLPANTGKAWTGEDDEQLRLGFEAGTPVRDLAAALGRTVRAVEARLLAQGLLALVRADAAGARPAH
jgi:hypothetical protein